MRSLRIDGLCTSFRFQFCDGGRLAVWTRTEEDGIVYLGFVDIETGRVVERWSPSPSMDEIEEMESTGGEGDTFLEFRGEILVCRGGSRIVYKSHNGRHWYFCDDSPDGWFDTGPVPNDFEEDLRAIRETWDADMTFRLRASPDGSTVVMVADVRGYLNPKYRIPLPPRSTPPDIEDEREDPLRKRLHEARAEVWAIDAAGEVRPRFRVPPIPVESSDPPFAVSGGDPALLAVVADGRVLVWDTVTGELPAHLPLPGWHAEKDRGEVGVLFSRNGRRLVVSFGGRAFAWDTADWAGVSFGLPGPNCCVAVSPHGDTVAAADSGTVWVFDAATGAAREPITTPEQFSPVSLDYTPLTGRCASSRPRTGMS